VVTYAVVDAQTGSMISSHGSFDAARAEAAQTASDHPEHVSIYVFDDTGHVAGECAASPA
jgi:flavin-binding protein dodecin